MQYLAADRASPASSHDVCADAAVPCDARQGSRASCRNMLISRPASAGALRAQESTTSDLEVLPKGLAPACNAQLPAV